MSTIHREWTDQHNDSNYPFADRATLRSSDRKVTIPQQAIIDAVIATPLLNKSTRLSLIERTVNQVILTFSQGSTVIATATTTSNDDGWVTVIDDQGAEAGQVRINQTAFASLFGADIGTYRFTDDAATLVPWVTFYRPRQGVTGFRLPDGTIITGDVTFIAGDGLEFRPDGTLDVVGDPNADIPAKGLIPRGIRTLVLDDGATQEVTPSEGKLTARAVAPGSSKPAIMISNPSPEVVRIEVTG